MKLAILCRQYSTIQGLPSEQHSDHMTKYNKKITISLSYGFFKTQLNFSVQILTKNPARIVNLP